MENNDPVQKAYQILERQYLHDVAMKELEHCDQDYMDDLNMGAWIALALFVLIFVSGFILGYFWGAY